MLIGLTGGIASGKSLVAEELRRLGAHLIDADEIAREIVRPGLPAHKEIIESFGEKILNPDKTINRKMLGQIVFADSKLRKKLERITHPGILDETDKRIAAIKNKKPDAMIVMNAPLLIEVGLHKKMDKVIVVYADEKTQMERLIRRDGLTADEARNRISSQMPINEKRKYADFVIENGEGKKKNEIRKEVKKVFDALKV